AAVWSKLATAAETTFPREARSAGWAERRLDLAEYTQGFTSLPSTPLLRVPGLESSLEAAEAAARRTATELPSASTQAEFDRNVIGHLSGPPSAAGERDEITMMLGLQEARTSLDERIAGYFANGPALDWFDAQAARITKGMSVADAASAQKLLDDVFDSGHSAVHGAKQIWERPRPFQASTEIHTSTYKKADSGSYVSGHTSNAVGMGHVLAALDPTHAKDYLRVAHDMAHARVVAGAHFPSDTAAGAFIGTRAAIRTIEQNADVVAKIRAHTTP
ncbi:MAG: acid phosphatase, partial [Thermoleophilia bacterium]|nr:acid phosphatase [Thermoleophilia bacterium]